MSEPRQVPVMCILFSDLARLYFAIENFWKVKCDFLGTWLNVTKSHEIILKYFPDYYIYHSKSFYTKRKLFYLSV